ncbi:hypothetical protein EIL87_12405 [Saccharopolyspora rhizosphaerae]|uniref:Uncharacterized protein n=1 Tax=Saccharopolyspora rhizosphaerae TaxID=2492662 RepID=A0A426JVC0_9PSEU|nr:hypothetical protein [Saccharopolyspora rhizosphaerae]RRO17067.1 hypothetical protein EIL87_12405 [Saccharopolyspora rhizosphaerae]
MTSRPEYVVRQFRENECLITAIVRDPGCEQAIIYGVVTRRGRLVGSYYCLDHIRDDCRIVTADGQQHETTDPKRPLTEPLAVYTLTNMATPPAHRLA